MDEKMKIPTPSKKIPGSYIIAPSTRLQFAILIHQARKGHSKAELARALGTFWPAVQRLENPRHWPTLKQLEKVAGVLGKQVRIEFIDVGRREGNTAA